MFPKKLLSLKDQSDEHTLKRDIKLESLLYPLVIFYLNLLQNF